LVLLASSEQCLQHALDRFAAACDQAGMKISTKKTRYYVSTETQGSVRANKRGSTLQQVEKFKYRVTQKDVYP